jgi:TPR repeat protein
MKKDPILIELAKHSSNNEIEILHSENCSCYFCRQTYSARNVNDWVNDERGVTAICPECGMDAVIGDACGIPLDKALLKEMNLAYYGEDYMEKHPAAALKYIERYKRGNITHKKFNEMLYIQYLSLLASTGNSQSAYDLGQLYENGTEFTPQDAHTAFSYYGMKCLSSDGGALTRLGMLSKSGALGKVDPEGAYHCFAKGMATGSLEALIHFLDCYVDGTGVPSDPLFAYDVFTSIWPEVVTRFVATNGKDITVFPDLSFRLAAFYRDGLGGPKDPRLALKYYLYAEFGFNLMKSLGLLTGELTNDLAATEKAINEIALKYNLRKQDPVFDNDTFADSLLEDTGNPLNALAPSLISTQNVTFDKNNHQFSFDITSANPQLIVDAGNLFCGFVPGTIRWDFIDVADVKIGRGNAFGKVTGNADDGWDFLSSDESEETPILSVILLRDRPHKKNKGGERKA